MTEKHIPSVLPVYCGAAAFTILAFILPVYRLWALLLALAAGIITLLVCRRLMPGTTVFVPAAEAPPNSGDEAADRLIREGRASVMQLRELNRRIPDEALSQRLTQIESSCGRIFSFLEAHPDSLQQIKTFTGYYLPTTLRLLEAYAELSSAGDGENVTRARSGIEKLMGSVAEAFTLQYDKLFEGQAVDVTADIQVMESMLAREGLKSGGSGLNF